MGDAESEACLPEVLSVIIGGHIVDMNLIAFFEIVEEKMRIGEIENNLFNT